MFMGEYNHTIDAKGRLIVPSKFREQLGEAFVVTKGLDGCLYIYTEADWESVSENLKSLPPNKNSRQLVRFLMSGAERVEVDKQGRILVPTTLRDYAKLEKDVVLAGVAGKIEVWNKESWLGETACEDIDDIAEQMADLGLMI